MEIPESTPNEKNFIFDQEDVVLESSEVSYQGFFRVKKLQLRHRLFDGGWTKKFTRELFERGDAVCVLLYDPNKDIVVLTEQFRIGALNNDNTPWLLETVAGMIDDGETPEQTACRETAEETGSKFSTLIPIYNYFPSPGGSNERIHLYCGLVDSTGIGGIHGLTKENEDIKVTSLTFDQAWQCVEAGSINNASLIIALQWLKINRSTLTD